MRVLYLNCWFDRDLPDEASLLRRYESMTGWCEAVAREQELSMFVVQRFSRDDVRTRHGVEYHFVRDLPAARPRWGRRFRRCLAAVGSLEPDVLHVNGSPAPLRALRAMLGEGTALLWQHHGGPPPPALLRPLYRRALAAADGAIFTSDAQGEEWKQLGLLAARTPVHAVPESSTNMLPSPAAAARTMLGADGDPLVLWIGRLDENKDPLTVLRGFAIARATMPRARLIMLYREAPLEAKVRRLVASLALGSSVRLTGYEPPARVAQWLSAADLFVSGSRREGSGFALLEAMACGVWPVVTDIPAFRALTRNGSIGHLWQSGAPETLASALESAWRMRPSREAVRAHFAGQLSFERIGALAAAVYRSSAQARAAARSAGMPA